MPPIRRTHIRLNRENGSGLFEAVLLICAIVLSVSLSINSFPIIFQSSSTGPARMLIIALGGGSSSTAISTQDPTVSEPPSGAENF